MSTTPTKRTLADATADAMAFQCLFDREMYENWTVAGSVRRGREAVSDVEHVVVPRYGEIEEAGGLFTETRRVNLVMHHLDKLASAGSVKKHVYGGLNGDGISRANPPEGYTATRFKWGEKSRGVDYRGFCHEIYAADAENLGSVLAIRTGPGGYSKMLVNALQRNGYMNDGGYVWNKNDMTCAGCGWRGTFAGERGLLFIAPEDWTDAKASKWINGRDRAGVCPQCRKHEPLSMQLVPAPDERAYFKLCGVPYVAPAARMDPEAPR
ncbi:MAG TPA: hypothetical protein VF595_08590 [Tepidisphaeraceae bacterium]|jgi:hypothetical protein